MGNTTILLLQKLVFIILIINRESLRLKNAINYAWLNLCIKINNEHTVMIVSTYIGVNTANYSSDAPILTEQLLEEQEGKVR